MSVSLPLPEGFLFLGPTISTNTVGLHPVEYVKADLAIQVPGVELLMKCMEGVKDDPITYDLLKDYLKDEEEDLFWSQGAVELIEKIDARHWLRLQL